MNVQLPIHPKTSVITLEANLKGSNGIDKNQASQVWNKKMMVKESKINNFAAKFPQTLFSPLPYMYILFPKLMFGDYSHLWPLMSKATVVVCGCERFKQ